MIELKLRLLDDAEITQLHSMELKIEIIIQLLPQ